MREIGFVDIHFLAMCEIVTFLFLENEFLAGFWSNIEENNPIGLWKLENIVLQIGDPCKELVTGSNIGYFGCLVDHIRCRITIGNYVIVCTQIYCVERIETIERIKK